MKDDIEPIVTAWFPDAQITRSFVLGVMDKSQVTSMVVRGALKENGSLLQTLSFALEHKIDLNVPDRCVDDEAEVEEKPKEWEPPDLSFLSLGPREEQASNQLGVVIDVNKMLTILSGSNPLPDIDFPVALDFGTVEVSLIFKGAQIVVVSIPLDFHLGKGNQLALLNLYLKGTDTVSDYCSTYPHLLGDKR